MEWKYLKDLVCAVGLLSQKLSVSLPPGKKIGGNEKGDLLMTLWFLDYECTDFERQAIGKRENFF